MWIWEMPRSDGGSLSSIVADAHRFGVSTLMIKSGDGTNLWSQFSHSLVSTLHANGSAVCAWQYVYGSNPVTEAYVGAAAVHDGADCLIIDAESEYEGKYVSAQIYIQRLRALIGDSYPLALAGFPYVDYHPAFPYSVFLGPGGAQYNAAADVLEGHRHHDRRGVRPHLRLQPHLPAADLPAGPGLRPPAAPVRSSASASSPASTAPRGSAGGTGRRPARPTGSPCRARPAPCPATSPT